MPGPALAQALTDESQGLQQNKGQGWRKALTAKYPHLKKLPRADRRRVLNALQMADFNKLPEFQQRLLQPDGHEWVKGFVGADGNAIRAANEGLKRQSYENATALQERDMIQLPDL